MYVRAGHPAFAQPYEGKVWNKMSEKFILKAYKSFQSLVDTITLVCPCVVVHKTLPMSSSLLRNLLVPLKILYQAWKGDWEGA